MVTLIPALGYLRTSSATNVGEDKDSDKRQRAAIDLMAARNGYQIVDCYYDAGISGDMPVHERPGFTALLDRVDSNGVRTVIVESADRSARKMLVAELGILLLINRGVTLLTAGDENLTDTDDPMRVAFRQIALAFAQLEKARLVAKLKGARDRASERLGRRCEGRKGYIRSNPSLAALARSLRPGRTLLAISVMLAAQGHVTASGRAFSASQVKRLIE
jgi:DNA invertase Pin-like site-specific DNA recombinase